MKSKSKLNPGVTRHTQFGLSAPFWHLPFSGVLTITFSAGQIFIITHSWWWIFITNDPQIPHSLMVITNNQKTEKNPAIKFWNLSKYDDLFLECSNNFHHPQATLQHWKQLHAHHCELWLYHTPSTSLLLPASSLRRWSLLWKLMKLGNDEIWNNGWSNIKFYGRLFVFYEEESGTKCNIICRLAVTYVVQCCEHQCTVVQRV